MPADSAEGRQAVATSAARHPTPHSRQWLRHTGRCTQAATNGCHKGQVHLCHKGTNGGEAAGEAGNDGTDPQAAPVAHGCLALKHALHMADE